MVHAKLVVDMQEHLPMPQAEEVQVRSGQASEDQLPKWLEVMHPTRQGKQAEVRLVPVQHPMLEAEVVLVLLAVVPQASC